MIAIAESGSTKCEWVIIKEDSNEVARIRTQGFNPYFHSSELVKSKLLDNEEFFSFSWRNQGCTFLWSWLLKFRIEFNYRKRS